MLIEELVAKLGIEVDNAKWSAANKKLKDFKLNFLAIGATIVGATVGLAYFESKMSKFAGTISAQAQILQIPVKQMQALKLAAEQAFVPFSAVTGAVGGLQTALAGFRAGRGLPSNIAMGLSTLARDSGVAINPAQDKNGMQLFTQIANALAKVKRPLAKESVLNQIFGNSNLLPLVGKGMAGINSASSQLGKSNAFYSPENLKNLKQFSQSLSLTEAIFSKIAMQVAGALLPVFKQLNSSLISFTQNKKAMTELGNGFVFISDVIKTMVDGMAKFVELLGVAVQKTSSLFKSTNPGAKTKKYAPGVVGASEAFFDEMKSFTRNTLGRFGQHAHDSLAQQRSQEIHHHTTYINHGGLAMPTAHVTGGIR